MSDNYVPLVRATSGGNGPLPSGAGLEDAGGNVLIASGSGTFSIAGGKTFTVSNTLTLAGTDGSTLNVGTGGTLGTAAFTAASAYDAAGAAATAQAAAEAASDPVGSAATAQSNAESFTTAQISGLSTVYQPLNTTLTDVAALSNSAGVLTNDGSGGLSWGPGGGGSGIVTLDGDSGSATGSTVTLSGGTTGLTLAGASATVTLGGTLVVANGGSGADTFTAHGVLLGEGTSPFGVTAAMANGQLLIGATGADPAPQTISGSGATITLSAAGVFTISAIANASLTNSSVTVNGTSIALGASGTVTAAPSGSAGGDLTGTYPNPTVAANAITYAKMQVESTVTLLGNPTGSGAVPSEITLGAGLNFSGTTLVATGSGGTVTSASVTAANGVSATVATATTTPDFTFTLGAITPTSVNGNTIATGTGTLTLSTHTLTVAGTASVSGTNTGDQTPGSPSARIAGLVINGSAATFMRSDAAPALASTITQAEAFVVTDAVNGSTTTVLTVGHDTSGTAGAGFGVGINFTLQDSTTPDQGAGAIDVGWTSATHGSTTSRMLFQATNTSGNAPFMGGAGIGTAAGIAFLANASSPVVAQTGDVGTAMAAFGLMTGSPTFACANLTGTISSAKVDSSIIVAAGTNAFTGNQSMGSNQLNSLAAGTAGTDAVNLTQMNAAIALATSELSTKLDCQAATVTTLAAYTYNNVATPPSGVGATISLTTAAVLVIDGYTPFLGDRILVKNETGGNAPYNGVYTITTLGTVLAKTVLTRTVDFDQPTDGINGALTFVLNGTVNGNTLWSCTTAASVNFGTTNINWFQFQGTTYTADGTTLTLTGTTFSIATGYVGQTSITTLGTVTDGTWHGTIVGTAYGGTGVDNSTGGTANQFWARPNGATGAATYRAIVAADVPTLNQSTSGNAATATALATARTIAITGDLAYTSPSFDGSGNVTAAGTLATVNSGPGTYTNANLTVNAKGLVTAASSGSGGGLGAQYGLLLSNDASTPNTVIDVAAGSIPDSTYTTSLTLGSAFTKILQASGAWTAGTGNNGLDTGAITASTTYHVYVISKAAGASPDVLMSLSATSPTLPSTYTLFRRVGSIMTNSSTDIRQGSFVPMGMGCYAFYHATPTLDVSAANPGTSAVTRTLTVPTGIKVTALLHGRMAADNATVCYLSSLAVTDVAASFTAAPLGTWAGNASLGTLATAMVPTNTSAQIRSRLSVSDSGITLYVATVGFIDSL